MSLIQTLEDLVRFPTVTGNHDASRACFSYIKNELAPLPLVIKEHTAKGYQSLVCTTRRTKRPLLWLAGHIDVVPAAVSAFHPRRKKGRLIGRGVFDMKFAIACYIEFMKELGTDVSAYDVGLMLTSDEEVGGFHGTKHLLEHVGYGGECAFLPDGGGPWLFEERAKGKWIVAVTTTGVAAHGSRPWYGRSATAELVTVLSDLGRRFEAIGATAAEREHDHWHATLSIGTMRGGEAENVVAAHAEATLDIRHTGPSDVVKINRILHALERVYPNTRFHTVHCEPAYGIRKSNGYAKDFAQIAGERHAISCGWTRSHGSSDGRFFTKAGIPTLLVLPLAGGAHSTEEWVDINDLKRYYDVMNTFVRTVTKRSVSVV